MNSVENVPPTVWVGESGVRSPGCSDSSASRARSSRVVLGVADHRRVPQVVGPLVGADLLGEPGRLAPRVGRDRRLLDVRLACPPGDSVPTPGLRAHPDRAHRDPVPTRDSVPPSSLTPTILPDPPDTRPAHPTPRV